MTLNCKAAVKLWDLAQEKGKTDFKQQYKIMYVSCAGAGGKLFERIISVVIFSISVLL